MIFNVLTFLLMLETVYDFTGQLLRLGVVFLTMIVMSERNPFSFLTLKPLIALGDCSYSVYLVHWPLFTLHRYWYPEQYIHAHSYPTYSGKSLFALTFVFLNLCFLVGLLLICASFVLGYITEEFFKSVIRRIRSWLSLMATLVAFSIVIGVLLAMLRYREPELTYVSLFICFFGLNLSLI